MRAYWISLPLIIVLLAGCASPRGLEFELDPGQPDARSEAFETNPCPFDIPEYAQVTAECGTLTVPEDRDDPSAAEIKLPVAIYKSTSEQPKGDPVLFLLINPSGQLRFSPFLGMLYGGLLTDRDLIAVDVRGVGYADPSFACEQIQELYYSTLDQSVLSLDVADANRLAYRGCRDTWAAEVKSLDNFNSDTIAADLIELRQALGYRQWNIISIGYGTRLAQMLMRDDPQGTRAVVMDSIEPIGIDVASDAARNAQRALDLAFQRCAEDKNCGAAYPDLRRTFYELVDQLNANPLLLEVPELNSGKRYTILIDGYRLIDLAILSVAIGSADTLGQLPRMIYQVRDGRTEQLISTMGRLIAAFEPDSPGLRGKIHCEETLRLTDMDKIRKANQRVEPQLEDYYNRQFELGYENCQVWESLGARAGAPKPATGNVPALILSGEYDPWVSPQWVEQVAKKLGHAYQVVLPGLGSTGIYSGTDRSCSSGIIAAFINDPDQQPDISCTKKVTPLLWITLP